MKMGMDLNVSINSPSGEGGEIVKKAKNHYVIQRVSINSPSGEGGESI